MGPRSLVTGGGGFIGVALVQELLQQGHKVRVLDNFSRGSQMRLKPYLGLVEIVDGDVRDLEAVRAATDSQEMVWHLACVNGTRHFYEHPDLVLDVAVNGSLNTLKAASEAGVRRYVVASSAEAYATPDIVPTPEETRLLVPDPLNPRWSYGGGKIITELLTLHLGSKSLETIIFRPHNVFGPNMGHEHVIPNLTEKIVTLSDRLTAHHVELPIQGDGSETRAFCYVSDAAHGAYLAGMRGTKNSIYHVGTEREISIRFLAEEIGRILGVQVTVVPGPLQVGGTPRRCPDTRKLGALGYAPSISLEHGLSRAVQWYASHYMTQ